MKQMTNQIQSTMMKLNRQQRYFTIGSLPATSLVIISIFVLALNQLAVMNSVQANRMIAETIASYQNKNQNNDLMRPQRSGQETGPILGRSRRSPSETPLAALLDVARKQEYRKQLNYQLSDLLARAAIDKSLEKALLNALFQQQQQQVTSGVDSPLMVRRGELTNTASERQNSLDQTDSNSNYGYADLATIAAKLAAVSDSTYLNANDVNFESSPIDYISAEAAGQTPMNNNKRSMLPCNFNAVSCAKNPFRRY